MRINKKQRNGSGAISSGSDLPPPLHRSSPFPRSHSGRLRQGSFAICDQFLQISEISSQVIHDFRSPSC
ncbi:unnamed protein product [Rhodiola kirilowii]